MTFGRLKLSVAFKIYELQTEKVTHNYFYLKRSKYKETQPGNNPFKFNNRNT